MLQANRNVHYDKSETLSKDINYNIRQISAAGVIVKTVSCKLIAFFLLSALAAPLWAAGLDSKLGTTAKKLTEAAEARAVTAATLAVFPFQADAKLSKKKVNFAVSEILIKNFLKLGKFTVIERAQLEEVMKEQKLGLSGAVDSKTAADIGKLAGAKLLVLGNVIQVGNFYQLNSKLVDSETGEIIASEIIEVPVKTFDEDADRYLVLVPDYQALGLYGVWGSYTGAVKKLPAVYAGSTRITPTNSEPDAIYWGGGVRYFITPKWMIDAAIAPVSVTERDIYELTPDNYMYEDDEAETTGIMVRVVSDRVWAISSKLRTHLGVGLLAQYWNTLEGKRPKVLGAILLEGGSEYYVTPLVRLGLEWRPQPRIGWAVFGQYNILKKSYTRNVTYQGVTEQTRIPVSEFTLPRVMLETTVSVYF